jgi:hypothetical protein
VALRPDHDDRETASPKLVFQFSEVHDTVQQTVEKIQRVRSGFLEAISVMADFSFKKVYPSPPSRCELSQSSFACSNQGGEDHD